MNFLKYYLYLNLIWILSLQFSCAETNSRMQNYKDSLDLSDFRWKNRLILLFSPSKDDSSYKNQKNRFDSLENELADRDLIVFHVYPNAGCYQSSKINQSSAQKLRKYYGIEPKQSTVLLIGKDGGVKLQEEMPIEAAQIFALIDKMPMRIREMEMKKSKN